MSSEIVFHEIPPLPIVQAHLIVVCVVVGFAVISVGVRFYVRFIKGVNLWWDDWLCLAALPQGIAMVVIQGLYTRLGVGYDITETFMNIPLILRLLVAYEFIFASCIASIKLSMLCFYLRIFVNDGLRKLTIYTIYFVSAWSIGNILQVFLICRPFRKTYEPLTPGTCGDQVGSFIAIGAFNLITDILILGLPLKTIWDLQMKTHAKIGITIAFLFGLTVSGVAIARIVSLLELDLMNLTGTMIYADFWSAFEPNLGIICITLPMLGPTFTNCTVRAKTTSPSSGPSGSSYNQNSKSFNRLHDAPEGFPLDTVYAENVNRAAKGAQRHSVREDESFSGSETALAQAHPPAQTTAHMA
ncbi:hypothetical protein B0I35DRAFT_452546 [Stachybotrys elegans]|uniref:Rhodopsin domain-containing protein n=1 Tax=Stachybotrys elegans TaxID=80388 RepID=A0A8K0SI84_9HYPO|nr:hypothetical protein B0I35DRAFT_452546 [Stachybotrys elegans]